MDPIGAMRSTMYVTTAMLALSILVQVQNATPLRHAATVKLDPVRPGNTAKYSIPVLRRAAIVVMASTQVAKVRRRSVLLAAGAQSVTHAHRAALALQATAAETMLVVAAIREVVLRPRTLRPVFPKVLAARVVIVSVGNATVEGTLQQLEAVILHVLDLERLSGHKALRPRVVVPCVLLVGMPVLGSMRNAIPHRSLPKNVVMPAPVGGSTTKKNKEFVKNAQMDGVHTQQVCQVPLICMMVRQHV